MLRAVEGAGFERVGSPWRRRWIFRTPSLEGDRLLSGRALRRLLAEQERTPVAVLQHGDRTFWMHGGRVVSEREGLGARDVAALLAERAERAARRLDRARDLHDRGAATPPAERRPVPRDLRRAVWERDGGRCTGCGSAFDLQYDHVIPLALGGASTLENLQLLCGACNGRKGAWVA